MVEKLMDRWVHGWIESLVGVSLGEWIKVQTQTDIQFSG
jgi:hypothetical protein